MPSPDPAGLAAVDPSNPQSWNRYAYVMNDPLDWVDPSGLDPCPNDNSWGAQLCKQAQAFRSTTYYNTWNQFGVLQTVLRQIGDVSATLAGAPIGDTQTTYGDLSLLSLLGGNTSGDLVPPVLDPVKFSESVLGSIKFQVKLNLIAAFCKDKESTRITTSMRNGAIFGAGRGAYTGFVSGEAVGGSVTFGTSGLAGAAGGVVAGGLAGSIGGFVHGAVFGQVCQSLGAYD